MADIAGMDPQALVVLVVAVVAAVPVAVYYRKTSKWFVVAFACLFVAAVATNVENLLLPDLLNLTEHVVGNMGAGVAFAVAAYMLRTKGSEAGEAGDGGGVTDGR